MLLLSGTLPIPLGSLAVGKVGFDGRSLTLGELRISTRYLTIGATAMIAAAYETAKALDIETPTCALAGDAGSGDGSKLVYRYLSEDAGELGPSTVTLHYILPLRDEFMGFVEMTDYWQKRPFLIADAGALLIAKATGLCRKFDLFTPDAGEIAFLADPDAGHPAYVKAALFEVDTTEVPDLVERANEVGNAPKYLLVKGPVDYVAKDGKVVDRVSEPSLPVMEAIGGTGDTVTGIVSALVGGGFEPIRACLVALRANRMAGQLTRLDPATSVFEIITHIGEAVRATVDSG
ncbi:MAG: sugar kinase [Nitrososphaerota archaeon]|nr:sugar kinase [Nitrososphaerota archaeon]